MDKPVLVLDLDETLIWAREGATGAVDFEVAEYGVTVRPHFEVFKAHVARHWRLGVWTSSSPSYAQVVVGQLFSTEDELEFAWDVSRCTHRYDSETQWNYPVKNLDKLKKKGYPLERMAVLDDTPQKLERHYGNLIRVEPFEGDPNDTELTDLLPFLDWLSTHSDIRRVEKRSWRSFNDGA